jgi:hypothetical protein
MTIIVYRGGRCFERRYTRDWQVPLVADDDDFKTGWQNIPLPPSYDDGWVVFDSSRDKKTGWERELCAPVEG